MKPLATAGRTADAAKADEFDQLKRRIHNKLVDKLDLNRGPRAVLATLRQLVSREGFGLVWAHRV